MVTKECLKRIIWILLSAVFLVGCYDDGNYIAEEETIESESSFLLRVGGSLVEYGLVII